MPVADELTIRFEFHPNPNCTTVRVSEPFLCGEVTQEGFDGLAAVLRERVPGIKELHFTDFGGDPRLMLVKTREAEWNRLIPMLEAALTYCLAIAPDSNLTSVLVH